MLSEKGLLIIEKLAEHNNELVTSKALAAVSYTNLTMPTNSLV